MALLEHDPAERMSPDEYRLRYLEFAADQLALAISSANNEKELDREAEVELALATAALDNAEADLERLGGTVRR